MKTSEIKGYRHHRLQTDDEYGYYDAEKAFVEEFQKSFPSLRNVENIVGADWLDEGQLKAVVSVIQWLGTPVGKNFVNNVMNKLSNGSYSEQ